MPRKTTILIIILALVTVGLLFMALRSSSPLQTYMTPTSGQATRAVEKTAKLFFAPSTVSVASSGSTTTADIMLDSGESDITGVQLSVSFDPKAVTSFTVTAPQGENTFFGTSPVILLNSVDLQNGKAEFSITTSVANGPKSGNGKVATINLGINRSSTLSSSQVSFLNTTTVVKHGEPESVLKEATPLTIQLKP